MDIYLLMIPTILIYGIYYLLVVRRTGLLSIDNMFIISQIIMQIGTFPLLDMSNEADIQYSIILASTTPLFILSSFVGELIFNHGRTIKTANIAIFQPSRIVYMILAFSIIVTALYYQSVGYSVFFLGISSIFSGQEQDIASLRLASYAGSRYLFPGYVNQFKNTILPGLSIILLIYLFTYKFRNRYYLGIALATISLIGLLGTGQRGAFILSVLTLIVFMYYYKRSLLIKSAPTILFITLSLFFTSSLVLNRNDTRTTLIDDPIAAVAELGGEFSKRILYDNQFSGLIGFRYVAFQNTQHGGEWISAVTGLLPGESFRGSDLAGQIFKQIYGTDRGTLPISLWGSLYYNFGYFGALIAPLIMGLVYKWIYSIFSRRETLNHGEIYALAGIFITLGTWVADGPITTLNTGLLAYVLIFFICRSRPSHRRNSIQW